MTAEFQRPDHEEQVRFIEETSTAARMLIIEEASTAARMPIIEAWGTYLSRHNYQVIHA
jgi:hypothetical protein